MATTTIRNFELTGPDSGADHGVMTRFEICDRTNTVTIRHCDMRPGAGSGQFACYQGRSLEFGRRVWASQIARGYRLTKESTTTW